jgi:hypothetical protein
MKPPGSSDAALWIWSNSKRSGSPLHWEQEAIMSDGREEREEREKRREAEEREDREDRIDHNRMDEWKPERVDS